MADLTGPGPEVDGPSAEEVTALVSRTEVREIRMQKLTGELLRTPPDQIEVRLSNSEPLFSLQQDALLVLFTHRLEYIEPAQDDEPERPVGSIEVTHLVELELRGDGVPPDDAVSALVYSNVLFMVYPYVRSALHRLPSEFGLPPILLPYLRRDMTGPAVADPAD